MLLAFLASCHADIIMMAIISIYSISREKSWPHIEIQETVVNSKCFSTIISRLFSLFADEKLILGILDTELQLEHKNLTEECLYGA